MKLVPIVFILIFITVFITFFPNIFGGFEEQHNVTALDNPEEYAALTELTQTDMVIIGAVGTLCVLGLAFILARVV